MQTSESLSLYWAVFVLTNLLSANVKGRVPGDPNHVKRVGAIKENRNHETRKPKEIAG